MSFLRGVVAWIPQTSWRSHVVAVAIQAIPNVMRDLIRILNKFSIKFI
ncbi:MULTISPECIES: hypothetical protein [unclassified Rickettsia]